MRRLNHDLQALAQPGWARQPPYDPIRLQDRVRSRKVLCNEFDRGGV